MRLPKYLDPIEEEARQAEVREWFNHYILCGVCGLALAVLVLVVIIPELFKALLGFI